MDQAYKICVGLFKQNKTSGTAYGALPSPYTTMKWNLTSIIPVGYDFTNFGLGDTTIETTELNTITQLTKEKQFSSGAVTPPTWSFNKVSLFNAGDIVSQIKTADGDDPFEVLVCAGYLASDSNGTRTYTVSKAAAGILTADGGLTGEAKQNFTGQLSLQCNHIPLLTPAACAEATMTWNTSTNTITLVPASGSGS